MVDDLKDRACEVERIERLRDERAAVELGAGARFLADLRSHENQRQVASRRVRADSVCDLPTAEPRHHHIEDRGVRGIGEATFDRLMTVGSLDDPNSLRLQVHATQEPHGLLVVGYKHPQRVRPSSSIDLHA